MSFLGDKLIDDFSELELNGRTSNLSIGEKRYMIDMKNSIKVNKYRPNLLEVAKIEEIIKNCI